MSKWLVGSSSNKKLASEINTLASATRDFSPPESTFIFLNTSSPENKKQPNTLRNSISVFVVPVDLSSSNKVFSTCKLSSWCWAKNDSMTLWPVRLSPSICSVPEMTRNRVDFPFPLAPIKAILSPRLMVAEVFLRITLSPYALVTCSRNRIKRPGCVPKLNLKFTFAFSSMTSSIISMRSSALTRDWTCLAFEALALNRSINRSVCLIWACWFSKAPFCTSFRNAFSSV